MRKRMMQGEGDFDFRRHHGFRNPPVPPPAPFPGAWEYSRESPRLRRRDAHDRFAFRRPPGVWRLPIAGGAAAASGFDYNPGSLSYSWSSPHFGTYRAQVPYRREQDEHGATAGRGGSSSSPQHLPFQNVAGNDDGKPQPSEMPTGAPRVTRMEDPLSRNILSKFESAAGDVGSNARGHEPEAWEEPGRATNLVREDTLHGDAAAAIGDDIAGQEEDVEDVEEGDFEEESGLVMSPEWADHFRNSPSVQRYLQRVRDNGGPNGGGKKTGKGGRRGKNSSKDGKSTAATRKIKQSGTAEQKQTDSAAKAGAAEAKEKERKAQELELAKIKARALLYATQQQIHPLEGIAEET